MSKFVVIPCLLLLLAPPRRDTATVHSTPLSEVGPQPDSLAAARAFVQRFYDDYLILTRKSSSPYRKMLDASPSSFDAELATMLRDDLTAARDSLQSREILEMDPFLTIQDTPCGPFKVRDVRRRGAAFVASVAEVCPGKPLTDVPNRWPAMEIVSDRGRWVISDMYYNDTLSLTRLLCSYAKADVRPARRPKRCEASR